jgi:hypothetical protein
VLADVATVIIECLLASADARLDVARSATSALERLDGQMMAAHAIQDDDVRLR